MKWWINIRSRFKPSKKAVKREERYIPKHRDLHANILAAKENTAKLAWARQKYENRERIYLEHSSTPNSSSIPRIRVVTFSDVELTKTEKEYADYVINCNEKDEQFWLENHHNLKAAGFF